MNIIHERKTIEVCSESINKASRVLTFQSGPSTCCEACFNASKPRLYLVTQETRDQISFGNNSPRTCVVAGHTGMHSPARSALLNTRISFTLLFFAVYRLIVAFSSSVTDVTSVARRTCVLNSGFRHKSGWEICLSV